MNTDHRQDVEQALDTALQSFISLVDDVDELDGAADLSVPDLSWTVADVVAHVHTLHRRAIDDLRRSDSPAATAILNEACLIEQPQRRLAALATLLRDDGARAHASLRALPVDVEFPFHAGSRTTVVPVSGVMIAEYLVHADDIRRATGMPGEPDPALARISLLATLPLLRWWGLPGPAGTLDVQLSGTDDIVRYQLHDTGIDAHSVTADLLNSPPIEVGAADLLLAFPFGRRPLPAGCAALSGRLAPI